MRRPAHYYWRSLPAIAVFAGSCVAATASSLPSSSAQQPQSPVVQLAQATVDLVAPSPPPPLRPETIPPPPPGSSTLTWEAGYWSWNGNNWVWLAGHYVERPSPQAVWEPGHWVEQPNGWLWVEGRWRVAAD